MNTLNTGVNLPMFGALLFVQQTAAIRYS